jgi:hypothetical protein
MHSSSWVIWDGVCDMINGTQTVIFFSFFPAMTVSFKMTSYNFCGSNSIINLWNLRWMIWIVMPCELIDRYQHFREKYSLHLQGWSQDGDSIILQNASISLWRHTPGQRGTSSRKRLNLGNACYLSGQSLLPSCLLSRNVEFEIYKTIIPPPVLYGCETWSLTLKEEHRLRVFENRCLRRILGPKWDEVTEEWSMLQWCQLIKYTYCIWTTTGCQPIG